MLVPAATIQELLKSLLPKTQDELSLLRLIVECAQRAPRSSVVSIQSTSEKTDLLALIPAEARRYFHGLAEAVEIYQSIHGEAFQPVALTDSSIHTVRQIRDLCFDEDSLRPPF